MRFGRGGDDDQGALHQALRVPAWTMGFGGSGGAIQQLLIAQNFPDCWMHPAEPDVSGTAPASGPMSATSVCEQALSPPIRARGRKKADGSWQATRRELPGLGFEFRRHHRRGKVEDAHRAGAGVSPGEQSEKARAAPPGTPTWLLMAAIRSWLRAQAMDNIGVQYGLTELDTAPSRRGNSWT